MVELGPFLMILKTLHVIKVDPFNLGHRKSAGWLYCRLRNWEREDKGLLNPMSRNVKRNQRPLIHCLVFSRGRPHFNV